MGSSLTLLVWRARSVAIVSVAVVTASLRRAGARLGVKVSEHSTK